MAWLLVIVTFVVATPGLALAQGSPSPAAAVLTADDYARAERFLAAAVNPLVVGGTVNASWLPDDRFTYRSSTGEGGEFMLVDPVKKTRVRAFDHERLAAALATASGTTVDAKKLPFQTIELSSDGASVAFDVGAKRYSCDVQGAACASIAPKDANAVVSPDGARAVFIKDWNLWVRDIASQGRAAAHHRRRGQFRLRHRQRRLEGVGEADRAVVARLEEGGHLPAGRTHGWRDVPGGDQGRASGAEGLEVPAAG